jgi:mannose-6-phosphate isomerase-like protein (cupin superfamily)
MLLKGAVLLFMLGGGIAIGYLAASPQTPDFSLVPAADITAKLATPPAHLMQSGNYNVMIMRRVAAGTAEWHEKDTDVVYVIDGAATLVTGGTMPDVKTTEPGEKRSPTIAGGTAHHIAKGDVLTIPGGMPHWFSAVEGSVTYFVVKVR